MSANDVETFPVEPGFEVKGPYRLQGGRYKVFQKDGGKLIFVGTRGDFKSALTLAEKLADEVEK